VQRSGDVRRLRDQRAHLQHDDYNGDVTGKIVLALDHEPGERDANSPFDGVVTSEPSTLWRKVVAAQDKGAVAVLFVSDVHNHPASPTSRRRRGTSGRRSHRAS
jgi:hypothetical protein